MNCTRMMMMFLALIWVNVASAIVTTGVPKIDQFFSELHQADQQINQLEEKLTRIQYNLLDLTIDPSGFIANMVMREYSKGFGTLNAQIGNIGSAISDVKDSAIDNFKELDEAGRDLHDLMNDLPLGSFVGPDGSISIRITDDLLKQLSEIIAEVPDIVKDVIARRDSLLASVNQTQKAIENVKDTTQDALDTLQNYSFGDAIKAMSNDLTSLDSDVKALGNTIKSLVNTAQELPQAVAGMNKLRIPAVLKKIKQSSSLLESLVENSQKLANATVQSIALLEAIATNKAGDFKMSMSEPQSAVSKQIPKAQKDPVVAMAQTKPAYGNNKYTFWAFMSVWLPLVIHAVVQGPGR